jgi:hypothetical protein
MYEERLKFTTDYLSPIMHPRAVQSAYFNGSRLATITAEISSEIVSGCGIDDCKEACVRALFKIGKSFEHTVILLESRQHLGRKVVNNNRKKYV